MAKGNGGTRVSSPSQNGVIERLKNSRNFLIAAGMQRYDEERGNPAWDYSDMSALSETDKTYLVAYLSNAYGEVNKGLRSGGEMTQDVQDMVRGIDKAVEKLTPYSGTVYRGIEFDTGRSLSDRRAYEAAINYYRDNVGKDITEKGYVSTGMNQTKINRKFTSSMVPSIKFTIESKTGRNLSRYNNEEDEVLFRRNTRFRVVSVRGSSVHLREI